jgi:hypothetical protein
MTFVARLIFIVYFLEVGLLLVIAPWSVLWDRNYFIHLWPALGVLMGNGYVRGAVSGLGFINLAAAVAEFIGFFRKNPNA